MSDQELANARKRMNHRLKRVRFEYPETVEDIAFIEAEWTPFMPKVRS